MSLIVCAKIMQRYNLDRFKKNYNLYYGVPPVIHKKAEYAYLEGLPEKLKILTFSQMALFYAWRIKNKIKHTDPFTDTDFNQLQYWLDKKWISRKCIGAILKINTTTFSTHYSECLNVKKAYDKTISHAKSKDIEVTEWKGVTLTNKEWAKALHMHVMTFRVRKRNHGVCALTFMTKEEYKTIPKAERDKQLINKVVKKPSGNSKYSKLSKKKTNNRSKFKIEYNVALSLVSHLIQDSKSNLVKGDSTKTDMNYFDTSQRFLKNTSGQLEYYLEVIAEINLKKSLAELYWYATKGYLIDRQREEEEKKKNKITKRPRKRKFIEKGTALRT
jgi:hypothetical protein